MRPLEARGGVASAGREDLDAEHVSRYDGKEDVGAAEAVCLLRRSGLSGRSVVVDLGAGTGQRSLVVAPWCARVVAVDVSPVVLEVLRADVAAIGVGDVEVVQAGLLTYEHTGAPADVVHSRCALHHLPDACAAWSVTAGWSGCTRSTCGTSTRPPPGCWSR